MLFHFCNCNSKQNKQYIVLGYAAIDWPVLYGVFCSLPLVAHQPDKNCLMDTV